MLGRTRPASRFLLWPRSTTGAVRFITTTTTTDTNSSHEGTTTESMDDHVEQDAVNRPKRKFGAIRRHTIRWMKANTEPRAQIDRGEKLEGALEDTEDGDPAQKKEWAPIRKLVAPDMPGWADLAKEQSEKRQLVKGMGREQHAARRNNRLRTAQKLREVYENKAKAPAAQWKPFALNPELAAAKRALPPSHAKPFTLNPDLAARSPAIGTPIPRATSPSVPVQEKNNAEPVKTDHGTPNRSDILGEMMNWSFEAPSQAKEVLGLPTEEAGPVLQDGAPTRSQIISEMKTWNYVVPSSTEADTTTQEVTYTANYEAVPQPLSRNREKKSEVLPPLDREFRDWLISATEEAVHEAEKNRSGSTNDSVAVYNGPTVLVLTGASRSLLASDFYRLAGQGKHLGDWAVGIARVVQARDPKTYEPMGKYYIFFETRAAALAYSEEAWRLQLQSRRAGHLLSTSLSSWFDRIPGPLPLAPTLAVDKGAGLDLDAVRGFTLIPHTAMLYLKLHLCKDLRLPAQDRLSDINRDLLAPSSSSRSGGGGGGLQAQGDAHHFVLVNLEGCKTTIDALHDAIDRDGEERRLPWGLATRKDGRSSITAVKHDGGFDDDDYSSDGDRVSKDGHSDGRFWRFLVPFSEPAAARRFVRNWHRQEMRDPEGRNMIAVFNVTALW